MFISFEGIDGSGKSTILEFIVTWLESRGVSVYVTREPGGTPMAEAIRKVMLSQWVEGVDEQTEQLLLFAARHQHLHKGILPALAEGKWVLCDRFTDSTLAYQSDEQFTKLLAEKVHSKCWPDMTLWFDVDLEVAAKRMTGRKENNRFDQAGMIFQQKVAERYQAIWQNNPQRVKRIDANQSREVVSLDIQTLLKPFVT